MDPISQRAADDYHRLLRDETGLAQELEERFLDRMREARLTFGGRVLCSFPRPDFVSPADYTQIQGVCRAIFRAVEKVEAALGKDLWDRVDLRPEERELAALEPGYRRSSPTSRLDSFLTRSAYQFVELNAESPAGIAYNEVLAEVFLGLPVMKAFRERWSVRRFRGRERLLETLLRCYRESGGRSERPVIAIVDYEEVPTRVEHHLFREFFESQGYSALVCDPRQLSFDSGRLRQAGVAIDIVYRRLLVNEFLERASELQALAQAVRQRAVVMVNPFRCKPLHKKAIFAVLTDEGLQHLFTPEERSAIATHVPWTRRLREGHSTRQGAEIDLPEFVRANRERLVMKPNDEYGGKGVYLGWEMSQADWENALTQALKSCYVVQEKVDLMRLGFPGFSAEGRLGIRELVVDLDPFLFDGEVEGFLTRLSGSSLANVTSGGGQVPGFLVTPRNESGD